MGCETTDPNFTSAFVAGIVTDSISGNPIDSALVTSSDTLATSNATYTDTSGAYKFFVGSQGLHNSIFCRREGYTPQKKIVDLKSETTRVDFKMVP